MRAHLVLALLLSGTDVAGSTAPAPPGPPHHELAPSAGPSGDGTPRAPPSRLAPRRPGAVRSLRG